MLPHEEYVEENGKQAQAEFGEVSENALPVVWKMNGTDSVRFM